jgi:hypothetical protein
MPDFDTFWAAYPRKVGKQAARDAYGAAINSGATPEAIDAALERNKEEWVTARTATQYIPHPRTWLHQKRFQDYERAAFTPQHHDKQAVIRKVIEKTYYKPREEPSEDEKARVQAMMDKFKRGERVSGD